MIAFLMNGHWERVSCRLRQSNIRKVFGFEEALWIEEV